MVYVVAYLSNMYSISCQQFFFFTYVDAHRVICVFYIYTSGSVELVYGRGTSEENKVSFLENIPQSSDC